MLCSYSHLPNSPTKAIPRGKEHMDTWLFLGITRSQQTTVSDHIPIGGFGGTLCMRSPIRKQAHRLQLCGLKSCWAVGCGTESRGQALAGCAIGALCGWE